MNKERRKLIAKAQELINTACALLEQARDEESDYLENMPDGLKESERGCAAEEAVDALSEAIDALDNIDLSDL